MTNVICFNVIAENLKTGPTFFLYDRVETPFLVATCRLPDSDMGRCHIARGSVQHTLPCVVVGDSRNNRRHMDTLSGRARSMIVPPLGLRRISCLFQCICRGSSARSLDLGI
jgi:hypothetical protein